MPEEYQTIKTTAKNRKDLVKAIAAHIGQESHYAGPPTFAYTVGPYFVYCDCSISAAAMHCSEAFKTFLAEQGFLEKETLQLQVPLAQLDGAALKNLVFMLYSKQYLLNQALDSECFSISEDLAMELKAKQPASQETFLEIWNSHSANCRGISFASSAISLQFPISDHAAQNQALTDLAAAMIKKAQESKHIRPAKQKPENEKYYFRVWLIQLGLSGPSHKNTRNLLLTNLHGNSAFRTQEDADAFYAKQTQKQSKQEPTHRFDMSL